MTSHDKQKRKKRYNRKRGRTVATRRIRLSRWISRRLLPVLLLLFLANCFFPIQMQWLTGQFDTYIASPICTSVVDPYILEPLDQYILEPLNEYVLTPARDHILDPLDEHLLTPARKHIVKPLNTYILGPLDHHIFQPAGQALSQVFHGAFHDTVLAPAADWLHSVTAKLPGRTANQTSGTPASIPAGAAPGSSDFAVHYLDVGQGLSVLVKSGEHALLYDGGDRDTSSFVVAYLKQHGVAKLDYLIASHYDSDHLSGLIGVLRTTPVETVIGPDYVHDSQTYTSFQNAVSAVGKTILHPAVGSEYLLGDSYFTVLSPQKITEEPNNNSVAIRLVNGTNTFLLTGDAEDEAEKVMCASGLDLSCDVLCPGHHGSSTATGSYFLACTQPTWAVISVGSENPYGHPHEETLQRLADAGVHVLRTDQSGTIIAQSDGAEITWHTDR